MGLDRIASEETNDSKAGFYFIHTNLKQTRMYGQEINKSQKKKKKKSRKEKKIINELDWTNTAGLSFISAETVSC